MEKVVYLILAREKDSFNIIYAGNCEHTIDKEFFTKNSSFNCWIGKSGSEKLLYLAILPLFESGNDEREKILDKIIARYAPACNLKTLPDTKQYTIRTKNDLQNNGSVPKKTLCPCCGSKMEIDKILENTTIVRCTECGLSDTAINS